MTREIFLIKEFFMSSIKNVNTRSEKNQIENGVLYLVATPIGNLADLSERAVKVLTEVDFIAAEDTRNSSHLLSYLGIKKELISYFEHNKRERGEIIAARLAAGESCALITDAGTPAISDPGEDIVALCAKKGIKVTSIPGACAAITALTLSALPTGRFVFEGFLSAVKNERKKRLEFLSHEERTMIIYEAPHKLKGTLDDLLDAFGERRITLCRELTKLNEDIHRTTISGAIAHYNEIAPRGEYVLIIEGKADGGSEEFWQSMSIPEHVEYYISQGESKKDAIKSAARDRKVAKNEVYKEMI